MIYIGVDPGKKGGYAILFDDGGVFAHAWDDETFIDDMSAASRAGKCMACVEKVGARPGQGVSSMFAFGKSAGFIEGVLAAYRIPYQLILPRKWKSEFNLGSDKAQSIRVCKKLFPDTSLLATDRSRVDSDGVAEALLMAMYAKRHL